MSWVVSEVVSAVVSEVVSLVVQPVHGDHCDDPCQVERAQDGDQQPDELVVVQVELVQIRETAAGW